VNKGYLGRHVVGISLRVPDPSNARVLGEEACELAAVAYLRHGLRRGRVIDEVFASRPALGACGAVA
jgi:hypothetical protein